MRVGVRETMMTLRILSNSQGISRISGVVENGKKTGVGYIDKSH